MRKRTSIIFLVLLTLLVTSIFLFDSFSPQPIIKSDEYNMIHFIRWNPKFNTNTSEKMTLLENYDEEEILSYLSTCTKQRTLSKSNVYLLDDVALELFISTDNDSMQILLGNKNRVSGGYGTWIYQIQNSEEVLSTLTEMLLEN